MTASTGTPRVARVRRATRSRVLVSGVAALLAVGSLLSASDSGRAAADAVGSYGSATAKSAQVTKGSGITVTPTVTVPGGTLLSLLGLNVNGLTNALTSSIVTPLANALIAIPQNTTTGLANGLVAAGYGANSPSTRQPRPTPDDNYPACDQLGWDSTDCYAAVSSAQTLPANVLAAASAGTIQGYATGDKKGFIAAAGSSHPQLLVPNLSIDLGVAASTAQCDRTPLCTPTHTLTGGTVTPAGATALGFSLASGSTLAKVGNTSIADGATIPVVPNVVTATANGKLLTFNVTLSLTQLLTVLNTTLATLGGGLTGTLADNASTVTLGITIGPGDISRATGTQATAWGVDVGINLNADIKLNLSGSSGTTAGLLGSVELQTSGAAPNLTDLKLAYSEANSGTGTDTDTGTDPPGGPTGGGGGALPDYIPAALI